MILLHVLLSFLLSASWASEREVVDCQRNSEICREAYDVTRVVLERKLQGRVEGLNNEQIRGMKESIGTSFSLNRSELEAASESRTGRRTMILRSLMEDSGVSPNDERGEEISAPTSTPSQPRRLQFRSSSTGVRGGLLGSESPLCDEQYQIECGFWD